MLFSLLLNSGKWSCIATSGPDGLAHKMLLTYYINQHYGHQMADSRQTYENKRKQLIALRAVGEDQISERQEILRKIGEEHGGKDKKVSPGVWKVLEREYKKIVRKRAK